MPAPPFCTTLEKVTSSTHITGWFVQISYVRVAMERQTSKKPQKLDKFPPCPLNNPYSYQNSYVKFCRTGPLL